MNIAIVAGASSGLGAEYVRQLDTYGCFNEIWVLARRRERLAALRGAVRTRLRLLSCDLTEPDAMETLAAILRKRKPNVQILVNSAGIGKIGASTNISLSACGQMIDLNCRAAVLLTQTVLPYMHRGARILEICSSSAFQPLPYMNVYAASKAFLFHYSRALGRELEGTGISVTAVCPFWVRGTEFIRSAKDTSDSRQVDTFPFSSRREDVVRRSFMDSCAGRAVSTPGLAATLHRLLAKFVPAELMMAAWDKMRMRA